MLDFLLDILLDDIFGILFQIFLVVYGIGLFCVFLSKDFGKGGGNFTGTLNM